MSKAVQKAAEPVVTGAVQADTSGRGGAKWLFTLALFLAVFAFFAFLGLKRPADVDEGCFLVFGKSIFEHGRTLYLDFFSSQMPLLPYVYGLAMRVLGYQWTVARLLTALLAALIGTLLGKHALDRTGSRLFGVSVAIIYCFSPFVFIWFTCARTSVLVAALLMISVSFLPSVAARTAPVSVAASGFFLGLAVDTRLYIAAVIPFLAFHVSRFQADGHRLVWYFLGGTAAALALNLPLFLASPAKYVWNVFGFHSMRTPLGLVGAFTQKADTLAQLLLDYPSLRPTLYLGYVALALAYLASQVVRREPLERWNPAFHVGVSVFLVSLLPTPTFGRYFAVPVPFFLMLAVDLARPALDLLKTNIQKRALMVVVALGAVSFVGLAVTKVNEYVIQGNNLGGSMPTEGGRDDWRLDNVRAVSRAIDRLVAPDAFVFASWPGYLLEADVTIRPRTENVMMLEFADRFADETVRFSESFTDAEVRKLIETKTIDLFVYGNSIAPQSPQYRALLIENGYAVAERIGGISLFLSPDYGH